MSDTYIPHPIATNDGWAPRNQGVLKGFHPDPARRARQKLFDVVDDFDWRSMLSAETLIWLEEMERNR